MRSGGGPWRRCWSARRRRWRRGICCCGTRGERRLCFALTPHLASAKRKRPTNSWLSRVGGLRPLRGLVERQVFHGRRLAELVEGHFARARLVEELLRHRDDEFRRQRDLAGGWFARALDAPEAAGQL